MKKNSRVLFVIIILFTIIIIPGCKTTFVWDPTGVWTVNITYLSYSTFYAETFTFTGSEASGSVTGYTVYGVLAPQTGTYIKSGDYSIRIDFDFWGYGDHLIFGFNGTSSEANPNTMTGTGEWYLNGILENSLSWTATKTTNLQ